MYLVDALRKSNIASRDNDRHIAECFESLDIYMKEWNYELLVYCSRSVTLMDLMVQDWKPRYVE
jgi:hypothetical protein